MMGSRRILHQTVTNSEDSEIVRQKPKSLPAESNESRDGESFDIFYNKSAAYINNNG